ncbi:cytochrome P450 [Sphingomonas profundi]|uniref:cytochrome P450 n=1 Tax=Alterirhizorhabdus profundi TaxID=2681549 RepID=UPI0012E8D47D|nr:cytochrome P450 [Sphingomonas profundi]
MATQPHRDLPENVPVHRLYDIDIYAPSPTGGDYFAAWAKIHAASESGLLWTPRNDGHWIATRAGTITDVLSDYEHFSNRIIFVPKSSGEAHNIVPTTLDPPEHRPYRNILNGSLAPKQVNRVEESFRPIAAELIETFRLDGRCEFATQYAELFPIRIFMRIVDLPEADAPRLKALADQTIRPDGQMTYEEALDGLYAYLQPVIDARRGTDGQDMISRIVNGEVNGRPVNDREAREMCAQMLIAGLDTVVNFLTFMMLFLATHPEPCAALVADPARIPAFINELLRRFGIVTTGRVVREDYDYQGVTLRAGDMVVVPTALHGIDPAVYPDPLAVSLDRGNARHSAFGSGNHTCPGAHLARTEIRATLQEWLAHIPIFSLAPGSELRFSGGIVACVHALPLIWDPATTR